MNLEAVLGEPARFWMQREANYREALARRARLDKAAEHADFLTRIPLGCMVRFGWVRRWTHSGAQVLEVLRFFGVASVDAWNDRYLDHACFAPAFRRSPTFPAQGGATAAWLRAVEVEVEQSGAVAGFDEGRLRRALRQLRCLTAQTELEELSGELTRICGDAGVVVAFVPAPQGCPVSGATFWHRDRPVVALTLRHKTNDHLWFSFFHELGHVLLHGRRHAFLEGTDVDGLDPAKEDEANRFAADILLPNQAAYDRLCERRPVSEADVRAFATSMEIAPGIVVGRLQHDGVIPFKSPLNRLKVSFRWRR